MAKYTLDTDFQTLKPTEAVKWMCEFSKMAEEAFANQNNKTCLLGHLLLLKAYTNTVQHGLKAQGKMLFSLIQQWIDFLSGYMEGSMEPNEFQDFASNLYACVLEHNTGEELLDEQQAFCDEYFDDAELSTDEWLILEWVGGLLLELVVISGGELDFDFYEEFEDVEHIDLFYNIETLLNGLADNYVNLLEISNYNQVYQTKEYQNVVSFVCGSLRSALYATPEQFALLQKEYKEKLVVPEEHAMTIITF